MSAGNACAAIGLANTYKIPAIGAYVQDITGPVAPGAEGPAVGPIGGQYWDYNWLGEDFAEVGGILYPATNGAATGKFAQWVKATANLTTSADGTVAVSAGGVATAATGGAFQSYFAAGVVIPAGSYFWAFGV
jgi:hypothetical protein